MKVKIDENLSRAHGLVLEQAGHDVADVFQEQLAGAKDEVLWSHVSAEGRFLITLDIDFSDVREFAPGTHAGILLVRTTHPSISTVSAILRRVLAETGLDALAGCLAVAET